MLKVAHIADCHWRGLNRHSEYREIFQAFIDDVKKRNIDHIFIGGDIFHTKTTGISPEFIDQLTWWLKSMSSVAHVHVTLGNHDGNLVNLSRQDAISPIVEALKDPNITLYKKSGVYEFVPGYTWCVFSLFDTEGWDKVNPIPGKINIACYHGPVAGAKTESDWLINDGLNVEFFNRFDFAFLGDIHKLQFLDYRDCIHVLDNEEVSKQRFETEVLEIFPNSCKSKVRIKLPWIAYPGSTVQQNYAEDVNHGYLSWTIRNRDDFTVEFSQLPNPQPFITLEWAGIEETFNIASKNPSGSRFRIKSLVHIPHKEIQTLTKLLKTNLNATEVTFKIDQNFAKESFIAGGKILERTDLRNHDVLFGLVSNYHQTNQYSDDTWQQVNKQIKKYLSVATQHEETIRNTKWFLKHLKFDNTFTYGEGNQINFDNLQGVVGIFGPNRTGKSSIVGTLMYALHNTTDRGPIKNMYVCNIRKPYCYTRAIVNVNGIDYVFERQTTKHENKKGQQHATTALNVFRVTDTGELQDMGDGARSDTEKVIKQLIGNHDDFMLTSLAAQGEINQFIQQGSTKRRQVLSRFLDLDIFDKMHDLANKDVNTVKSQLKNYPEKDWNLEAEQFQKKIVDIDQKIEEKLSKSCEISEKLSELKFALAKHNDFTPVTIGQVESQRIKVSQLQSQFDSLNKKLKDTKNDIENFNVKLSSIQQLVSEYDLSDLKKKVQSIIEIESNIVGIRHAHDSELTKLNQQQRSLKILNEVPCGDAFPTCRFIKDAYDVKSQIKEQIQHVESLSEKLSLVQQSLNLLKEDDSQAKLEKLQKLSDRASILKVDVLNKTVEFNKLESQISTIQQSLLAANDKLNDLEEALKNTENAEVVSIRLEIEKYSRLLGELEKQKLQLASDKGKIVSDIEKSHAEKKSCESLLEKMKVHELISTAFSKKGIPNVIVTSQLPLINAEIAKILAGIVDFTVELEVDEETEWMDVYINYGDSKRVIELASGMEKMISSIAIRVALINISTLPKTDIFIIDEGFGALDDSGVEACNRLLTSLKRYFKSLFVITHVDGIKDIADQIIDITKDEKDAKIIYE